MIPTDLKNTGLKENNEHSFFYEKTIYKIQYHGNLVAAVNQSLPLLESAWWSKNGM